RKTSAAVFGSAPQKECCASKPFCNNCGATVAGIQRTHRQTCPALFGASRSSRLGASVSCHRALTFRGAAGLRPRPQMVDPPPDRRETSDERFGRQELPLLRWSY